MDKFKKNDVVVFYKQVSFGRYLRRIPIGQIGVVLSEFLVQYRGTHCKVCFRLTFDENLNDFVKKIGRLYK